MSMNTRYVACTSDKKIVIRADLFAYERGYFIFICRNSIATLFRSITMTRRALHGDGDARRALGTLVNFRRIGKRGIGY